ncbi:MAG: protein kinase [Candidatus Aminicenantes bacterium]
MIGQTISHYKILEKLGEGGMGVVYKAKDTKLKRIVTLKFLPPHLTMDPEAKERFIIEAKAAAAPNHANIVTVHEINEHDNRVYMVMEYVEGENLKEKLKSGPLEIGEAIRIAREVAKGLQEAHGKGIVHRDIKSANIMITEKCQVKIMDFGLAKLKGQTKLTKEGTILGTAAYMSPEQAQGAEVDSRTDTWSLGVVLYEMITGQLPFKGEYEQAVLYSIMNENPEPPTALRPGVIPELERIINKALSKEPSERYQHLDEMNVDLKNLRKVYSPEVIANKQDIYPAATRQRRRFLIPVLLILAVIIAAGYFFFKVKQETETTVTEEILRPGWKHSIAVLPFKDFSPKKDQEYFCDGMTEAIIGKLTGIRQLKVISRTSVMRYKNTDKDIKVIGKELGVNTILEGSIQKEKDWIRVNAQLINVSDDSHLWQHMYERQLESVFAIQDDISLGIVNALKINLLKLEKMGLKKRHTRDREAYNLYMLGLFNWRNSGGSLLKCIEYFKRALEKDPNYALAYASLADTYRGMARGLSLSYKETNKVITGWYLKAKEAALKALQLDETLPEAHVALGGIKLDYDWDLKGAKQEFQRAIELNPGYARAYFKYAFYYQAAGDLNKALAEMKRAHELDPLSSIVNYGLGVFFFWARKYDRAIEQLKIAIAMAPNIGDTRLLLGMAYLENSMYEEALEELKIQERTYPIFTRFIRMFLYARKGEKGKLREFVEKEKKRGSRTSPFMIAASYAELGERDQVFTWLEKAYERRELLMLYIKSIPYLDNYRTDPRYKALLKKIGID